MKQPNDSWLYPLQLKCTRTWLPTPCPALRPSPQKRKEPYDWRTGVFKSTGNIAELLQRWYLTGLVLGISLLVKGERHTLHTETIFSLMKGTYLMNSDKKPENMQLVLLFSVNGYLLFIFSRVGLRPSLSTHNRVTHTLQSFVEADAEVMVFAYFRSLRMSKNLGFLKDTEYYSLNVLVWAITHWKFILNSVQWRIVNESVVNNFLLFIIYTSDNVRPFDLRFRYHVSGFRVHSNIGRLSVRNSTMTS